MKRYTLIYILPILIVLFSSTLSAQSDYSTRINMITQANFSQRKVPHKPDETQKIKIIIDTDAGNEIDDQWAMTLALLSPEKFEIIGFVAANFDHSHGGPTGVESSYDEIKRVLSMAGFKDKYPVYMGSHPMRYKYEPSESEGVDFMIEQALKSSPEEPVWLVALGSATNIASAYLKNPEIAEKAIFFWHGRTKWPERCWNFNVFGDRLAAMTLFHSPIPFILFDTGTNLTCSMKESEKRVRPYGEIGKYLHDFRKNYDWLQQADKGFFDLGDIAALLDPDIASWEVVDCPEVGPDLSYHFTGKKGKILRCYDINRDKSFEHLYNKLEKTYGN